MKRPLPNPFNLLVATALAAVACGAGGGEARAQPSRRDGGRRPARAEQNSTRNESLAAAALAEGVAALERGDATAAKISFARALAASPQSVEAHTYLGVIADGAGDLREAEKHFAAAAAIAPRLPSARNNYGAILLRLGRTAQAITQFEASLKLAPDQPSALVNLAQIHFAAAAPDELARARSLFARAQAITPDAAVARALAVIALRLGDTAAAKNHYREYRTLAAASRAANVAASNTADVAASNTGGVAAGGDAESASSHAALGTALLAAGLAEEAVAELAAAHALAPADADIIVNLARAHLARPDIPAAGRTLEAAVARGITSAPIYAALAEVYVKSNHIENAIPAMRLAIERDGSNEEYRFRYAMMLTETGAPAAAVIRLNESLEKFPTSPRLWFALGLAHFKSSKNDEAARAFTRVVSLNPKFAPALAYLGMTYIELGRYDEAVKLYEQALAIDASAGIVNYLVADALLKQNSADMARVESHLVRAVRSDETFAPARLALAKVHLRDNRLTEAVAQLERVVRLAPDLAEAHYQLGRVYGRLKRTTEAQTALANFKRLNEAQKEQAQNERREIVRRLADVRF
ncbi:MAG TPA: tetratricopeptide repeat protein [Pyrinomonadaceae bacterium]|nr:tetratricopeptide repeat protein [Pyrinomonadaceae bacterium]